MSKSKIFTLKSLKKFIAAFAMAAALGLTACSGVDDSGVESGTGKQKETATSIELSFKLPGSSAGRAAYTEEDAAKYKISAVCGLYEVTAEGQPGDTVSMSLEREGTYEITVLAYDSEDTEIAKGTVQKTLAFSKEIQTVEFKLDGYKKIIDLSIAIGWNADKSTQYVAGQNVILNGVTYVVISNNLGQFAFSRAAADETPVEDEVIGKFASDVYVNKLLKEYGITKYVELWNKDATEASKRSESGGNAYYKERFLIADASGAKLAEFTESWSSWYLMNSLIALNDPYAEGLNDSSLRSEIAAKFKAIPANELLTKYEPSQFKIETASALYGTDLSKKISESKTYNYDINGEVALTKANLHSFSSIKNYQKLSDGKERATYTLTTTPEENGVNTEYRLVNFNTSNFYSAASVVNNDSNYSKFYIIASGDGVENTDPNVRKNTVCFQFNRNDFKFMEITFEKTFESDDIYQKYDIYIDKNVFDNGVRNNQSLLALPVGVTEKLTKNGEQTRIYKNDGSQYSFYEAIQRDGFKDYITVSNKLVNKGGMLVPDFIRVKAEFSKSAKLNGDYLAVTLVPVETADGVVSYVVDNDGEINGEKVPSFVKKYSDAFKDVYDGTYNAKSSDNFYVTFTPVTCPACSTEYYTQDEVDACAKGEGCKGYHFCTNCHHQYASDAESANCARKSGCPKYVKLCSNCHTGYNHDEDAANCAKQPKCPAYTIAGESFMAGDTGDFMSLTFESFGAGALSGRENLDEVAGWDTYTQFNTFEEYVNWVKLNDDSTGTARNYKNPFIFVPDADADKSTDGEVFEYGKGHAYNVDGVVLWARQKNKIAVEFKKESDEYVNKIKDLVFASGSYQTGFNGGSSINMPAVGSFITKDYVQAYMKIRSTSAGTVSVTYKPTSIKAQDTNSKPAFVILVDKDGKILALDEIPVQKNSAGKYEAVSSTYTISAEVEKPQDVFFLFKKSSIIGQCKVNSLNFEAGSIGE